MKQIFKEGARLFGRLIIVFFMSVFICVSISGICTAIFTEEIGYEVYGLRETKKSPSCCIHITAKTGRMPR